MIEFKRVQNPKLAEALRKLPRELQDKILKPAARRGANIIAEQARALVRESDDPTTARRIANNIVVRYRKRRSREINGVAFSIGVMYPRGRMPKGNPDDGVNTPHWHLLELGTEKMPAQPFLLPAMLLRAEDVTEEIYKMAEQNLGKLQL